MSLKLYHLHPYVEKLCEQHKWLCLKEGIELLITCTFRPASEQAKLIAEGKSKAKISFHNFQDSTGNPCALAYDVVPLINGKQVDYGVELIKNASADLNKDGKLSNKEIIQAIQNGKWNLWDRTKNMPKGLDKSWTRIIELGLKVGMCWGGKWSGFTDIPHFEFHIWQNSCSASKLANKVGGTRLPTGYVFTEIEKEVVKG